MKKIIPVLFFLLLGAILYNNRSVIINEETTSKLSQSIVSKVSEYFQTDDEKGVILQSAKDAAKGAGSAVKSSEVKKAVKDILNDTGDFLGSDEVKSGAKDAVEGVQDIVRDEDVQNAAGGVKEGANDVMEYSGLGKIISDITSKILHKDQTEETAGEEGSTEEPQEGSEEYFKITPIQAEGTVEIHFLDVGQADCSYITDGIHNMLIDTGTDDQGTKIQSYLQKRGVSSLDYLILTHPDADHIGSADVILTKFDCKVVMMTDMESDTRTYERTMEAVDQKGYKITYPTPGTVYPFGDASFTILGPEKTYDTENDASICLRLVYGNTSALFTGDAGEEPETDMVSRWGDSLKSDILKIGHHGSTYSTSEEFLQEVDPVYALISCGENNDYGHPHARVLNLLRSKGIQLFRTDEQGTVVAVLNGDTVSFNMPASESWISGRG